MTCASAGQNTDFIGVLSRPCRGCLGLGHQLLAQLRYDAASTGRTVLVISDGGTVDRQREAARALAAAADQVGFAQRGGQRYRSLLRHLSGGRRGKRKGPPEIITLATPWQDTASWDRGDDWRTRSANLDGDEAFGVDYCVCRRCRLGWVEQPHTLPQYKRCGLASAALAQLRAEHPGYTWHTAGGHERDARPFWDAAGQGVSGGYRQARLCEHVEL